VVDDAGAPKASYHYLKRVLQPVNVLLTDEGGNGLFAHLINESPDPKDVELEISAWQAGDVLVATAKKAILLPAHSAQSLSCLEVLGRFLDITYAYRFGPKPCGAVVATLRDVSGNQIAQTFYFPDGMDVRQEPDVGLSARVTRRLGDTVEVTLSCKRLAMGLHFDVPGFEAASEYFHLAPGHEACITLRATSPQQLVVGTVHAVNSVAYAPLQAVQAG
jgi:beta-mannosidase